MANGLLGAGNYRPPAATSSPIHMAYVAFVDMAISRIANFIHSCGENDGQGAWIGIGGVRRKASVSVWGTILIVFYVKRLTNPSKVDYTEFSFIVVTLSPINRNLKRLK